MYSWVYEEFIIWNLILNLNQEFVISGYREIIYQKLKNYFFFGDNEYKNKFILFPFAYLNP